LNNACQIEALFSRCLIMQKLGQRLGAVIAIAAVVAIVTEPTPSAAFGLRIGPFYLGVPLGHRHHHHATRASEPRTASLPEQTAPNAASAGVPSQNSSSALLYPALALPAAFDEIFAATTTPQPWPFSYEAIFETAFAKSSTDQSTCQRADSADAVIARIQAAVRPTQAQMPQLQKLGGALHMAAQYLSTTCPTDIRAQPAARMQLMEWQIEKFAQAIDIVRPPLAEFQQSLNDAQRARFAGIAPGAGRGRATANTAQACTVLQAAIDRSIEQISQSVQPTDAQRDALAKVNDAFGAAASGLDAHCPAAPAADPLARLQAVEARLDATWRAVVAIQSALADFEKNLSDDQRARLAATDFAASQ
jgi:hypothetical protein